MRVVPALGAMLYQKPARSVEQQIELLQSRGLTGDHNLMFQCLNTVNYYRLSGYWKPFLSKQTDRFYPGVDFSTIWNRYLFDRSLRLILLGGIERIEVTTRTRLTQSHAMEYGPFGYATNPKSLPKPEDKERSEFLDRIRKELCDARRNEILIHFYTKYASDHNGMCPLWMACEVMRLGTLVQFLNYCSKETLKDVSAVFLHTGRSFSPMAKGAQYGEKYVCTPRACLESSFWSKAMDSKIPRIPQWHTPVKFTNDRLFVYLTIINFCLQRFRSNSDWKESLLSIFKTLSGCPTD